MIQTPYRKYQTAMKPLHLQLGIIADQERMAAEGALGPVSQSRWDSWSEQRCQLHRQIGAAAIALDHELQKVEQIGRNLIEKYGLSKEDGERICYFLESGWSEGEVELEIFKIQAVMQPLRPGLRGLQIVAKSLY